MCKKAIIVKKSMKHCDLWNDPNPPPSISLFDAEPEFTEEVIIDPDFFDMIVWFYKAAART